MITTKIEHDREDARDPESDQAGDRRLDQEGDRRAEHEGAEEVAKQVEHDDRDHQRPKTKGDLEIASAPLRIERQSRNGHRRQGGRLLRFALVGGPVGA